MPSRRDIEASLIAPGQMFEVVADEVDGVAMKVYAQRFSSLRDVTLMGAAGGDQPCVVYGERRYTFGRFVALANSVSRRLEADAGVTRGDRVAVLSNNNPEWCLAFWGTVNLGAIVVGLNGWWKEDEILYGLADSSAKVLVVDRDRFARIAGDLGAMPHLQHIYLIDADPSAFGDDPRLERFDSLLESPSPDLPSGPIDEADAAVIFYTSGTTGRPKGAISTHRSMIANLQNTVFSSVVSSMTGGGDVPGLQRPGALLLTSPLFHVSGCHSGIVVGMLAGLKVVIPVGRFAPEQALRLIQDEAVTVWATVPTMVWRVVEHPQRADYDLSSVTQVAFGGSPAAPELLRLVRATFPRLRNVGNAYGLTESSSIATVNSGDDYLEHPNSVGRPLPIVDVQISDPLGAALARGEVGEIWLKGPIIMPGYWGKPEESARTVTDGWLHSGDIGYLDADDFLYVTDRAKDMIIRGGENVYCAEIESRLVEHPEILDAAVIGVPHVRLGEEVKAIVRVAPASTLTTEDVRSWVAQTLADFKVPAHVDITTEDLPRNASGKLLKNVLRGKGESNFAETM